MFIAFDEESHGVFEVGGFHFAVGGDDVGFGNEPFEFACEGFDILDARADVIDFSVSRGFGSDGSPYHHVVFDAYVGPYGVSIDGGRGDHAHIPHAGEGHLECTGNGGCTECEDVYMSFPSFNFFFLCDSEKLFFIEDDESWIGEFDVCTEESVCPDGDVDGAVCEFFFDVACVFAFDEAREESDIDSESLESCGEGFEVLVGKEGCGCDKDDLVS